MHDLLVVLTTVVGLVILLWICRMMFDAWALRTMERRVRAMAVFVRSYDGEISPTLVMLVSAELQSRLFMTSELNIEGSHRALIHIIAKDILTLCQYEVRNQFEMLLVIAHELNREPNHKACVNITTNNRLELIVNAVGMRQPLYIKFHSTNTLF